MTRSSRRARTAARRIVINHSFLSLARRRRGGGLLTGWDISIKSLHCCFPAEGAEEVVAAMSEIELGPLARRSPERVSRPLLVLYHIILVGSPPKRRIPSSGGPRSSLPSERQAHRTRTAPAHYEWICYSDEKISSSPTATGQPQRYEDSIVFCDGVWFPGVRAAAADGALCGHVQLYQSYKLVLTRSAYIYRRFFAHGPRLTVDLRTGRAPRHRCRRRRPSLRPTTPTATGETPWTSIWATCSSWPTRPARPTTRRPRTRPRERDERVLRNLQSARRIL